MPRQSRPHLHNGYWRTRIDGVEHHLGAERGPAFRKFHALMLTAGRQDELAPTSLGGAVALYLEATNANATTKAVLGYLASFAGATPLSVMPDELLCNFAEHLATVKPRRHEHYERLSAGTIIKTVYTSRSFLRWCRRRKMIERVPRLPDQDEGDAQLPKPTWVPRDLSADELRKLLDELPDIGATKLYRFCLATGARPSEAALLRWSEVELDRGTCVIREHKTAGQTGLARTLYLTKAAKAILETIERKPEQDYVFISRLGKPYTPAGLRSILKRRGHTPYQLRHTFAQRLTDDGQDVATVAALLGHSRLSTVQRYAQVRNRRLRATAADCETPLTVESGTPSAPTPR